MCINKKLTILKFWRKFIFSSLLLRFISNLENITGWNANNATTHVFGIFSRLIRSSLLLLKKILVKAYYTTLV